jgi:HD-like signal output (HDOD) protein
MQNETGFCSVQHILPPSFLPEEEEGYASADPLPDVPIMLATRLQLELLLQEPVLDLRAVSEVILEDLGATLQILRLVGEEYAVEQERPIRIEDCIASLNAETWFEAVSRATLVQNSRVLRAWQHARRIGQLAEQLAGQEDGLRPGEGQLVGLLHEVGRLPQLLGWQTDAEEREDRAIGALLAEHWHLPRCVLAATREQREPEAPSLWRRLLQTAHAWAQQEEGVDVSGTVAVAHCA